MALTKVTGQVINDSTGLVVGVTTVGGGLSATDGFFSGIVTAVGNASFSGNVSVGGTLTYEDVTNIDAVGLVTARNGIVVGSGITLSKDGDIFATGITTISENLKVGTGVTISPDGDGFFTGVVTATTFKGDGSQLSNVTSTTINTNADNRVITGSDTANTLNGESTLTHSSGVLSVNEPSLSTDGKIIVKGNDTDNHDIITAYSNSSTRGSFAIRNGTGIAPSFLVGTRGGSETLGLMSNGTERFRIGASGQFGIGGGTYGSSGQVLTSQGSSSAPQWATPSSGGLFSSYAVITDEKSNGTEGGDFNSGAWRMRDLNTEKFDPDGIVSVSSNEFSLGTGTYYIEVFAPAYGVARHMAKIYSVSSPSQDWYGESAFAHGSHYATTHSFVRARITCSGTRNLAIAHQCETSRSSTGFGIASNFGNVETYTVVKIYKES